MLWHVWKACFPWWSVNQCPMTKSEKKIHYLYLDLSVSASEKSCTFPVKVKFNFFFDFSHVYFILNPCEIYFFIYLVIFLFFYFLLYFKIFIIKNFRFFGRLKTIFSSGRVSSFSFSFSITLSSSPIRRSLLIVCVVFIPVF